MSWLKVKKGQGLLAALMVALMAFSSGAMAQISESDLADLGTSITASADAVFSWVIPIFGTILAMSIGLKLVKRFTSRI